MRDNQTQVTEKSMPSTFELTTEQRDLLICAIDRFVDDMRHDAAEDGECVEHYRNAKTLSKILENCRSVIVTEVPLRVPPKVE